MERKRAFNVFAVGRGLGPYDERPVLPAQFDIQLHLSRNDRPQPFYLICDHDTVLVQLAGRARLDLRETAVQSEAMEPGTFVYVPAGAPHRLVPLTESLNARFKASQPELEGVAWYCSGCRAEVWREEWGLREELPQEGYWRACRAFNADTARRTCPNCGAEHPKLDLAGLGWAEVAGEVRAEMGSGDERE